MGARRRLIAPAGALLAALSIAACGEEDFKNEPRPPAPIALGARIGDDGVAVSPNSKKEVGAGEATITISNQTNEPARLVLEGPNDAASAEIVPHGTGALTLELEEGDYTVTNGGEGRETRLAVGPRRKSSQNVLLLP
jgi:hypothetical protein